MCNEISSANMIGSTEIGIPKSDGRWACELKFKFSSEIIIGEILDCEWSDKFEVRVQAE